VPGCHGLFRLLLSTGAVLREPAWTPEHPVQATLLKQPLQAWSLIFFFFFFPVLVVELRASHLLDQVLNHLSHSVNPRPGL
jgi:hypothetical protein